jgi:hypothetical protein
LQRDIKHPLERISPKIALKREKKGKMMEREREGERKIHTSSYEKRN